MNALAGNLTVTPARRSAVKVFVVEDSSLIRERLLTMLNAIPAVSVLGYAATATDAIEDILSALPDVVILDLKLIESSGIHVLKAIKQRMHDVIVIMLTNYAIPAYRKACMHAGADYFLDKTNEFQKIPEILDQLKSR
jgi:DNA-binding NarL/FixJ family response regulator